MSAKIIRVAEKFIFNPSKILIASSLIFLFTSCTTITDTLYVQDVKVKGPINQPPIRVTGKDSSVFTISPKFFINSKKDYNGLIEGHTKVNSAGVFQIDTIINGNERTYQVSNDVNNFDFDDNNLHWSIPDYSIGLDLDIALSRRVALSGGFTLSSKDKTNLYGYRIGLGFFSASDNIGVRFDGGLIWQKYTFDAASVIIRSDGSDDSLVIFFRDRGSSLNLNHYLSFTMNTLYEEFPVNFLLNLGYSGQSLIDYEAGSFDGDYYLFAPNYRVEDTRGEAYAAFINVSPGIYMNLNETSRLVFAVRFFFELDIKDSESSAFVIPMLQFDLGL